MSRDALVVGISTYQHLPSLSAPSHDAEAIAQRLQADGDFRVARMPEIVQAEQSRIGFKTQVSLTELEAALVRLFKPKGQNIPQTALFYFSGHGLQKDAGIQEGYLATSDVNPNAGMYGLSLFWLRRLLQESPVRQRIILLDCCHSGELLNFLEADPGARSGTDRLFMAASREYEAAYESMIGTYSVFTQAVLDGLDPRRVVNGIVTNYALTDWVSNALKAEMQQPMFENSGSEIVLTRGQSIATVVKTELAQEVCPYRGLEFFDEAHAEYFFGREDLTDQLIEKLRTGNFAAVVGASGSGKSSLVRAGLIHTLRQGKKFSGSDRWRIHLITPTDQPLKSLAAAFVNPKDSAIDRADQLRRAEALLRDGGKGLSHLVRATLMSAKHGRNSRLLLIIDQFEEVFTLCRGAQAEHDRHSFFNCLITALREVGDCLSIVVVLRADFFSKYSLYHGLAEQIEQNLVTATPLTYQQIKASIIKPAEKVGIVCEPNLVYNILLDIVGAPGELPLLQYTLLELWQQRQLDPDGGPARLTLDAYTELGGVRGTLQKRADEIFYSLSPEEQRVVKRIFIALTQIGDGTEDTRRRILKSELISPQFPVELVERVLEKLVMAKLIVTNRLYSSNNRHQERVSQELTNVSTALRLAQMRRGKLPQEYPFAEFPSTDLLHSNENLSFSGFTQLSVADLAEQPGSLSGHYHQETVDVAHEALIRNWTLLRTWLDENRELLQRQRRIEQAAREWYTSQPPQSPEYLLTGDRLVDAEDYVIANADDLSALAQRYISVSRETNRRAQKEMRFLQFAVPCTLLIALAVTFNQYRSAIKSQAEKDYQLQIATSRQQAAVAQAILQEPDGDPTTALLISRLAAEKGGQTYEARASLLAALQKLHLQTSLRGHQGPVHAVIFSPDQRQFATAGEDGTIRIWSLATQTTKRVLHWQDGPPVLSSQPNPQSRQTLPVMTIAFSPDGQQLAAIARGATSLQVWSVASGKLVQTLDGLNQPFQALTFSPDGKWLAATNGDRTVLVWAAATGQRRAVLHHTADIKQLVFSPDSSHLLTASGNVVQLWQTGNWQSQKILRHPAAVNSAVFNANGQVIATGCDDGKTRLWQPLTGQMQRTLVPERSVVTNRLVKRRQTDPHLTPPVRQVLFSPDGQLLATVDSSGTRLWNVSSGQLWSVLDDGELSSSNPLAPTTIAFSPDSQRLATTDSTEQGTNDRVVNAVHLWDVQTGRLVGYLKGHLGAIEGMQFSYNGSLIATASTDSTVRLWAAEMSSEFPSFKMVNGAIQWAAFRNSSAGQQANSASSMAAIRPDEGPLAAASVPAVLPTESLVTVATDGTIQAWQPLQPQQVSDRVDRTMTAGAAPDPRVNESNKHPQTWRWLTMMGKFFSSVLQPRSLASAAAVTNSGTPMPNLNPVAATPETQAAGSASPAPDETLGNQLGKLPASLKLTSVAFSADSQRMATASAEGSIDLWQVLPGKEPKRLQHLNITRPDLKVPSQSANQPTSNRLHQLAFSPNGQWLLGVGDNWVIYLWDTASGRLAQVLQGHKGAIEQAHFSPDGKSIVSASRDYTARVWATESGKLLTTITHRDVVSNAHFSPDGRLIVIASWDGTARVLDAQTGAWRVALTGHHGAVLDAEFSPDARTLVTASADGTARLWDAQTGTEQALLRSVEPTSVAEAIQQAFFSPNGRYIATLSKSGKLQLWAATWDELLALARDRSFRQLQPDECLRYLRLPPNECPALDVEP